MRAILHIPTGEFVRFVRLNAVGKPIHNGVYILFKFNGHTYSPLAPGRFNSEYPFRIALKEDEHIELLLMALTQCQSKFLAEEFSIVDIKENP